LIFDGQSETFIRGVCGIGRTSTISRRAAVTNKQTTDDCVKVILQILMISKLFRLNQGKICLLVTSKFQHQQKKFRLSSKVSIYHFLLASWISVDYENYLDLMFILSTVVTFEFIRPFSSSCERAISSLI